MTTTPIQRLSNTNTIFFRDQHLFRHTCMTISVEEMDLLYPNGMKCFWDTHEITTRAVGCPIKLNTDGTFDIDGIFCSLECALAFALDRKAANDLMYKDAPYLVQELAKRMGISKIIRPALTWRVLDAYGGYKDIKTFRMGFENYIDHGFLPPAHSVRRMLDSSSTQ